MIKRSIILTNDIFLVMKKKERLSDFNLIIALNL
jgi:hypothetical protein